jgi:hypothetical protein
MLLAIETSTNVLLDVHRKQSVDKLISTSNHELRNVSSRYVLPRQALFMIYFIHIGCFLEMCK